MGLFDGMGFGDGYDHSSSRGFMRSDYITGTGRGPLTEAEAKGKTLGTIAGLILGATLLFNPNLANRAYDSVDRIADYGLNSADKVFDNLDRSIVEPCFRGADKLFGKFEQLIDKVEI
jgi:hypothetical protein